MKTKIDLEKVRSWEAFFRAFPEFAKDREIALFAVQKDAENFEHLDFSLRDDLEIVKLAVAKNGFVFRYASVAAQDNPEIILLAASNCLGILDHVDDAVLFEDLDYTEGAYKNLREQLRKIPGFAEYLRNRA
jgi:hypothetical protein